MNKRIAFDDDDAFVDEMDDIGISNNVVDADDDGGEDKDIESDDEDEEDDDDVEEVTGSAARESIQRIRDEERKVVKESVLKKKRRKKDDFAVEENLGFENNESNQNVDEDEEEEDDDDETEFTDDFFKMVDSERVNQLQKAKKEQKQKKRLQKKMLGRHTTFVVEGEYEKMVGVPHKMEQNIEVVALGECDGEEESKKEKFSTDAHSRRQLLLSATLGSAPSMAAVAFARGGMTCGMTKERSSDSRKRKSKDEATWKRSRKLNRLGIGSRSGQAATLFVCKKKKS